jgi:ribose 5-phosphate isomerase B
MVTLNTAYDYDMTLEDALWGEINPIKEQTQARAKRDVEKGYNVFIITKRCGDVPAEAAPVYATAKRLGIPKENVIFTCFKEKVRALRENNIDLFLEDEEQSLMITRAATFTSVVSVFEKFNKGINWEDALNMKEKQLIKFYNRTIHIGGDHGGFGAKSSLRARLETRFDDVVDYGCPDEESCDYPDFGKKVAEAVQLSADNDTEDFGMLFCSTGQGMAMTANRFPGVRAALCWDVDIARLAREHNNANVLCIPSKHLRKEEIEDIVYVFFTTQFEGGRHQGRIDKIEHEN